MSDIIPDPEEFLDDLDTIENRTRLIRSMAGLRSANQNLRRENKDLLAELESTSSQLETLLVPRKKAKRLVIPKKRKVKPESVAFAILSDWHVEEHIKLDRMGGLNEYNLVIAKARSEQFFGSVVSLLKASQQTTSIRRMVLAVLGDLINGEIHPEHIRENQLSLPQATAWVVQELLVPGLRYLLENCDVDVIDIPWIVGNHERLTKKTQASTRVETSIGFIIARWLESVFVDEKRLKFHVAPGYDMMMDAYGFKVRMAHGDASRYGGGVGGVSIPLRKRKMRLDRAERADMSVIGHFHQLGLHGGDILVNGSLCGYSEYSKKLGFEWEPPQQAFFTVRSGRGLGTFSPVWVE